MTKKQFKDKLIAAREMRGLSQTELARLCGMAPTQLARYENGKVLPRRAAMSKIAKALGVDEFWLVFGDQELPDSLDQLRTEESESGAKKLVFKSNPELEQRIHTLAQTAGLVTNENDALILDQARQIWSLRCRLSATNTMLFLAVKLLEDAKHQDKEVLHQMSDMIRSNAPHVSKVMKFAADGFHGDPPWTEEMQTLQKRLEQLEKSEG
ncbi:MAG: helix-turn-helix domain-containing protein [Comamonas sp.]|jgi:transcriptional regulator with XRE-family HTH domain|uniref:helix-turn-helix domain-containing protein n=1 Tax=Comamonas sp. TaxID=34028 RepID=UPI002820CF3E|nr:helix-turn-helix transcriptional regulator [Comamonas sp.]MDR0215910.1 helix-turn-helix domain-containing protein [Comamonas sp.]